MITWDDSKLILKRLGQEQSVDGIAFLTMMANVGYKDVLARLNRSITEQMATLILTPNQRGYQMPPDCVKPKLFTPIDGTSRKPPLIEVASDRNWNMVRTGSATGIPTQFHYRPRFGYGGGVIEVDPIPSTGITLEMIYSATERDLNAVAETAGTISINAGSSAVVGVGTAFVPGMVGRFLILTADSTQRLPYRISGYTDATHITLENFYQGAGFTTAGFKICEMFNLPDDIQMLPLEYSLWQHWSTKGNQKKMVEHLSNYERGIEDAQQRYSLDVNDPIINEGGDGGDLGFGGAYPSFFPAGIVET